MAAGLSNDEINYHIPFEFRLPLIFAPGERKLEERNKLYCFLFYFLLFSILFPIVFQGSGAKIKGTKIKRS